MKDVDASKLEARHESLLDIDIRRLRIWCWAMLIGIAVVRAWFTRYEFDGDSVSYLDIARAVGDGRLSAAINGHWSPGYPLLLSFFLQLFHPNIYWECPLVHIANVLIFIGALTSFQFFWREARLWHESCVVRGCVEIPECAFWMLGYSVFAIATLNVISVGLVDPDLLVAAFCCLAGWSMLCFRRASSVGRALLLGLVLGLGYYTKAPFFPMGLVMILCASIVRPVSWRTILLGGMALVMFLLVCAPLITALSLAKGRLTFGDSARLNHAFFIDGVQHFQHWHGGPAGAGMPTHPTRKLNDFPEIYEFATNDMGTYPPWFDPSYWYEGVTPHINLRRQAKVFVSNIILEFQIIAETGTQLVCAAMILALLLNDRGVWKERFKRLWFIWVPGAMALLMYALVHVDPRYLGGWLTMFFAGAVCASSLPADGGTRRTVGWIGVAVLVTSAAALVTQASQEALGVDHAGGRSPRNALIAAFLLNRGLHPGDRVAVIGYGTEAYWAHLARLQVIAEVPAHISSHQTHPALDFWESGREKQQKVLSILERTGASAAVAGSQLSLEGAAPSVVPAQWEKVNGTDAYVYFFHVHP